MSATTPDRATYLRADIGEVTLGTPRWTLQRSAKDIRQQRRVYELLGGLFNDGRVFSVNGDAWILQPRGLQRIELLEEGQDTHLGSADVNLAPGVTAYPSWRKPDDLPGMGAGANIISTGAPAFQKRVPAGGSWADAGLTADASALPPPPSPAYNPLPTDRVLSGKVTYPANCPFLLTDVLAASAAGVKSRFYFGGATDTRPYGTSGGHWCLEFRADGQAVLYERDQEVAEWKPEGEFRWTKPEGGGNGQGLIGVQQGTILVPYGRNRLGIVSLHESPVATGGAPFLGAMANLGAAATAMRLAPRVHLFKHVSSGKTDHSHAAAMTGAGTVRYDRARDDRAPFSIARLSYPETGYLYDAPFLIKTPSVPLLTVIKVRVDAYLPEGTSITPTVYDAETGTALPTGSGGWLTAVAGRRKYFVAFEFQSDDAREQTPVLWGYTVTVAGSFVTQNRDPLLTPLHRLRVEGPDVTPDHELGEADLQDPTDSMALLRLRDQIRSTLTVYRPSTGAILSHLMEGQTLQTPAKRRGVPGVTYPDPDWHDYHIRMTGLWPRLEEQYHTDAPYSFASSYDSPHPQQGGTESGYEPWRVTDIIRWCLNNAGVHDDEIDLPDLTMRLWPSATMSAEDYSIWPGTSYGRFALNLARDMLGMILLRDPNAGSRGMWRLVSNPSSTSTNFLATIWVDAPPYPSRVVNAEGAYGANTYFVREGSWNTYPRAPEASSVVVYGMRQGGTEDGARLLLSAPLTNPGWNDPLSPHYLGRTKVVARGVDPFLSTQEAVNWVAPALRTGVLRGEVVGGDHPPGPGDGSPGPAPGPPAAAPHQ